MLRPGGQCAVPAGAAQRGSRAVQCSARLGAARSGALESGAALQPRGRAARTASTCGRARRLLRGRGGRPGLPARAAAPRRHPHCHWRPPLRHAGKSAATCVYACLADKPPCRQMCGDLCVCLLGENTHSAMQASVRQTVCAC